MMAATKVGRMTFIGIGIEFLQIIFRAVWWLYLKLVTNSYVSILASFVKLLFSYC